MLTGLYWRGLSNSAKVELSHNRIASAVLPESFDGFTILHISDVHVEMSEAAMARVAELLRGASYDISVLTGDYRAQTFGPYADAVAGVGRLREYLNGPIYGVLGNHDTIRMVPAFEEMGIRMLLNERRGSSAAAPSSISPASTTPISIAWTISRRPRTAFRTMPSRFSCRIRPKFTGRRRMPISTSCSRGHTHGGQMCLPGGIPVTLNCVLPRAMGNGASSIMT